MIEHPCILFCLFRYAGFGGIERVTAVLVHILAEDGFPVSICAFQKPPPNFPADAVGDDGDVIYAPNSNPRHPANRSFLREVLDKTKADIVVFQDCYQPMERLLRSLPPDVRLIVVEHSTPAIPLGWPGGSISETLPHRFLTWIRSVRAERWTRRRHRFLYDISNRYVLLSNRYFGEFRWLARLHDARKLRAIPNVNTFEAVPFRPKKRKEVLFLGSLLRVKGVDYLLDAWRRIAAKFSDWTLNIVGDGPLRDDLERIVEDSNIPHIIFHGAKTDVSPFLKNAAILAAPSRYEGFPMVLGEAMAHGAVPVCFDSYSALRDIVSDGESGIVVPAFDVVAFADAIQRLMADESLLQTMSKSAITSVERFSKERVLPMWRALFDEALREGKGKGQ